MSFFNSLAKLRKGDQAFAKLLYVSYSDLQTPGFEFQRCDKAFGRVNGGRTIVCCQGNHLRGFAGEVGKVELKNRLMQLTQ